MSATAATGKFVNFTILENELETLERKLFAPADHKKLERARRSMFEKLRIHGHNQLEVGLDVRSYHNFYVLSKRKEWTEQVGPRVMRAIGVDSLKSVYNLMRDVDFVEEHLTGEWPGAFIKCGMDPVARKNRAFILQFEESVKGKPTPNEAEAEQIAKDAIDEYLKQKKKRAGEKRERAKDPAVVRSAIVERIARFMLRLEKDEQQSFIDGIVPQVQDRLTVLIKEQAAKAASGAPAPKPPRARKLGSVHGKPGSPATQGTTSSASPQSKPHLVTAATQNAVQPASVPSRPPVHPWGYAPLKSLRISATSTGILQLELHRKYLHEIWEDKKKKRFLVGDMPDLFDDRVKDEVIDRHFSFFLNALQHQFLILTSHVERARDYLKSKGWGPLNVWIGATIESREDFYRLKVLGEITSIKKWASFVPFRSDPLQPLSQREASAVFAYADLKWAVMGWEFGSDPGDFSARDVEVLFRAAQARTCFPFVTDAITKAEFLGGLRPSAPQSMDPRAAWMIQSSQIPPGPHTERRGHVPEFEGPAVEILGAW